jgi:glycosyltransferase involved in cell wall biosynthesis
MKQQTTITIGIPVFNEEKYLSETIKSARQQTRSDIKIIISDNASLDSSYEIALKHAKEDERIKVFRHDKNIGAIENFIFLREKCQTKYFMWLGAHDLLSETFLEEAYEKLEKDTQIALVYPKTVFYINDIPTATTSDSDINTLGLSTEERILKVARNLSSCMAIHGLYRSEILTKIPFEQYAGDFLVILMTNLFGASVPTESVKYYRREVRIETNEERLKRLEEYKFIKNKSDDFLFLSSALKLKNTFLYSELSLSRKLSLMMKLKNILNNRFSLFSWKKLLKYNWDSVFSFKFFLAILLISLYVKSRKLFHLK